MRSFRLLAVAALAAAACATSAHASSPVCAGTEEDAYACVVLPSLHRTTITKCVYTGGDTCTPVSVPFYDVSGSPAFYCGGRLTYETDPSIC